jgi:hypothetical protein
VLPLLKYRPDVLLVDDPAVLKATLDEFARYIVKIDRLLEYVEVQPGATVVPWVAKPEAATFLNRDYHMLELPEGLCGQVRLMFAGGEGDRVRLRFTKPAVVFAAFEYNTTGAWSFPEGYSPSEFGWSLVKEHGYRGTSNATVDGKPHHADVYCRMFEPDEQLMDMPPWWLCLAIVGPRAAADIQGFTQAMSADSVTTPPFLYGQWATISRPLCIPEFESPDQWAAWQRSMRDRFRKRLVFDSAVCTSADPARPCLRRRDGRFGQSRSNRSLNRRPAGANGDCHGTACGSGIGAGDFRQHAGVVHPRPELPLPVRSDPRVAT